MKFFKCVTILKWNILLMLSRKEKSHRKAGDLGLPTLDNWTEMAIFTLKILTLIDISAFQLGRILWENIFKKGFYSNYMIYFFPGNCLFIDVVFSMDELMIPFDYHL